MAAEATSPQVGEDENLVINLNEAPADDAPPAANDNQPKKPPPVPGPSSTAASQVGLADLEKQLGEERNARARERQEAQRIALERDQAVAFAQEAERRGISTYELYADNQIQAMTDQMEAMTSEQERAYNDGDFKAVAEINKRFNRLGGQLAVLEREKAALAQQRQRQPQQPQRQPQRQQQAPQPQLPADPLERAIIGRTEPTKQFLRKHPELVRGDGSLKRSAIDAHERALDEGFTVDTEPYFRHIEGLLGGVAANDNAAPGARVSGYAAPVARGSPPGSGGPGVLRADGTFIMTPKMRKLAEEQGVPAKEWAENYVRLLKEGRVTPII